MSASEPVPSTNGALEGSKVGHRLRSERERLGIGLRELARRVGVSPSLVSQIELDRVNPSVSTLYAELPLAALKSNWLTLNLRDP